MTNKKMKFITMCKDCKTKYIKNIYLFNYCPICKGNNLKKINMEI